MIFKFKNLMRIAIVFQLLTEMATETLTYSLFGCYR